MAQVGNVRIRYLADTSSLERGTRKAESDLDRLNQTGKRAFGGLRDAAAGLGLALGVGGVALAVKSVTDAAKESELAAGRLRTQLDALEISYEENRGRIDEVIEAQSRLAALDDEELSDSFTTIVRVTGDVNRALELNALAADIARGKQIELSSAGELVAKVAGGNVGILSRYGISIEKGASATEALGELQRLFAGQAEAYGNSTSGAGEMAAVAWENAREQLGARLLPVMAQLADMFTHQILPAITGFAEGVDRVVEKIGGWKVAIGFVLSGLLVAKLAAIGTTITATVIPAITGLATASAAAGVAATGPAGLGKLSTFLKVGLPAAAAVGVAAIRAEFQDEGKWGEVGSWVRDNVFGEQQEPYYRDDGERAAAAALDGLKRRGLQLMAPTFDEINVAMKLRAMAGGGTAGEAMGEEFVESAREKIAAFFPSAAMGAIAPTFQEIVAAAEQAGIAVGTAFTTGMAASTSGPSNQFGNLPGYANAPGRDMPAGSVVFPLPAGASYTRGGGPGGGSHDAPDWQSRNAVDIMVAAGTPVLAVEDGTIVRVSGSDPDQGTRAVGNKRIFGYGVTLAGKSGTSYYYAHLDNVTVRPGQPVKAGQPIGTIAHWKDGSPHVHFAVSDPKNPADIYSATQIPGPAFTTTTPTTGSTTSSIAPPPRTPPPRTPDTSFPGISGISDPLRAQFEQSSRDESTSLVWDPKTKKYVSVKVGPNMKALKALADRIRTKELPAVRAAIRALTRALKRLYKNPKADRVLIQSQQNMLAAYRAEEVELVDLWETTVETWNGLKEAADAAGESTGAAPAPDSGPVGGPTGPGFRPDGNYAPGSDTAAAAAAADSPDLRAQLDQANARTVAAQRAASYNAAFVNSIGFTPDGQATLARPGGGTTIINVSPGVLPPSPQWLAELAGYTSEAVGAQGYRPASTVTLGV